MNSYNLQNLRIIVDWIIFLAEIKIIILLQARRPQVLFKCDSEGAYVMQEVCTEGMRCNRWEGEKVSTY